MKYTNRIAKLENMFSLNAGGLAGTTLSLQGRGTDTILEAVVATIRPDDEDLLDSIINWCHVASQTLVYPIPAESFAYRPGCNEEHCEHFFLHWIVGLGEGSWALPLQMPRSVLKSFDAVCGIVGRRCENCRAAWGNNKQFLRCPICGSEDVSYRKLSGPPWDAMYEYTPLRVK